MQQRTLIEDLKYQFQHGGMTIRLIFINTFFFIAIQLIFLLGNLFKISELAYFVNMKIFTLDAKIPDVLFTPWGLFTNIFSHFDFSHFISNMLMLYFSGQLFERLFSRERLLYTYLLGGLFGGGLEIIAHFIFPIYSDIHTYVIGASGSIMAIFTAMVFYRPNIEVRPFGLFSVKLIFVALFFLLLSFLGVSSKSETAHFAHLGGAILGAISIKNIYNSTNIVTIFQKYIQSFFSFFKNIFRKKQPTFKVDQGGSARGGHKTDEEYNYEQKQKQIIIDQILDKIGKSGYESLSKTEKELLFKQSKNDK